MTDTITEEVGCGKLPSEHNGCTWNIKTLVCVVEVLEYIGCDSECKLCQVHIPYPTLDSDPQ